ncbi:acetyltransferase [Joostella atrarenae]|uniref:Acetyltransferase n=1 Tax=Joostella atrarenae TaxID=679257 RepID=A0ABS9J3F7_9FLAO|nr:acetyltransferase [Joostella atrarenae]MCF8714883.1 acetyltransferase [Joostella atrarenae]
MEEIDKSCAIYGASGHAKVILDIVKTSTNYIVDEIYDDFSKLDFVSGIPVKNELTSCINRQIIIAIGDNATRMEVVKKLGANFSYITVAHSSSVISSESKIDKGTCVMVNAVINASSSIGKHCIINSGSLVEHDCVVEDFVHISPNATITGGVKIGQGTHIGAGAVVIPNVKIGKWVTVGAGAVIIKDIPDYAVVVGNPGKIIKYKNER